MENVDRTIHKPLQIAKIEWFILLTRSSQLVALSYYSNGSCAELRTQIYIGIEIGYIDREAGKDWMAKTKRIQIMLKKLSDRLRQ